MAGARRAVVDTRPVSRVGVDDLDARLLRALAERPRAGIMELSRLLGVARGTVQSRLTKLRERGVVTGFGPDVSPAALGYPVLAFTTLEISQGDLTGVIEHLAGIPEVLEVHSITGPGDLHCRVAARSNEHLQQVLSRILDHPLIARAVTNVALSEQIHLRLLPLVEEAADRRG